MNEPVHARARQIIDSIPSSRLQNVPSRPWVDVNVNDLLDAFTEERRTRLREHDYDPSRLELIRALAAEYARGRAGAEYGGEKVQRDRIDVVVQGRAMRDRALRAARYHLRNVPDMAPRLTAVARDSGAAAMSVNLEVLALIVNAHIDAFANDLHFDAQAFIEQANDIAPRIRAAVGADDGRPVGAESRDLRDRASIALAEEIRDLEAACTYVFYDDTELLDLFRDL